MFCQTFKNRKPVIGMVHLKALPGSPAYTESWERILELAVEDAENLDKGGVDGLQIENQFDRPFCRPETIGPETTAFLTAAVYEVRRACPGIPIGINIHLNGGIQAMAAAKAGGAQWIRVFELAGGYISESGYLDALGSKLLRYRKAIDAERVMIFGDFQVKHGSHAVTADRTLAEKAADVENSMADAAVITGTKTGKAPDISEILEVKKNISIPLIAGSGVNINNVDRLWYALDGAIIGSGFKRNGDLNAPVDSKLVTEFMEKVRGL